MIIAFENLFGRSYEGGARWLESTLAALGQVQEPPTCLLVGTAEDSLPHSIQGMPYVKALPLERQPMSRARRLINAGTRRLTRRSWEDEALKKVAETWNVDLWIGFAGFEGLGAHRKLLVCQPDFQFRHLPELFDRTTLEALERQWSYIADRADGIIVISQSVAEDALRSNPEIRHKLYVEGFTPSFTAQDLAASPCRVRSRFNLPDRFFLICNQLWKHKNHILVLKAMKLILDSGRLPIPVVLTGRMHDFRHPDYFSEILHFVQECGLRDYVFFLGVVSRDEQVALIRSAVAVIQPSKFEGRGAISEEAAVLGAPLICSDLPVHRELDIPGAYFFDVDDPQALAELLQKNFHGEARENEFILCESRRRTKSYGERLLDVFASVVQSH
jgi:glycosyltransferase involved in cell wall biosynthesis